MHLHSIFSICVFFSFLRILYSIYSRASVLVFFSVSFDVFYIWSMWFYSRLLIFHLSNFRVIYLLTYRISLLKCFFYIYHLKQFLNLKMVWSYSSLPPSSSRSSTFPTRNYKFFLKGKQKTEYNCKIPINQENKIKYHSQANKYNISKM